MRRIVEGSIVLLLSVVSATCAAKAVPQDGHGFPGSRKGSHPVHAKIVIKRDPANAQKCVARTMPKRIEVDFNEDDGVVWQVRQHPGSNCLSAGVDLELRWSKDNPTACAKLGTHTSGNKKLFECDLGEYLPKAVYTYKLFRVGGGLNEEVEDPEIEIVVF